MALAQETEAAAVERWGVNVLMRAGLRADAAGAVCANLAYAEARGLRTHGFVRLAVYLERIEAGGIVVGARPEVVRNGGATAVVDCHDGPGAVGGAYVAELAIRLAGEHGAGFVAARNANHFGAAGYYAETIVEAGMVGLVACNTDAVMAPPAGGRRVLGTNPIAIAVPGDAGVRPLLDMATSGVAYGKLIVAAEEGSEIPLDWAVDGDGAPTSDPRAGLDGALLPAAGPKGFGLAYMIDMLAAMGGAQVSPDVHPLYGDRSIPQGLGFAMLAIDPEALEGALFAARVRRLAEAVRAAGRAGEPAPLIPGEPESRFAADHAGSAPLLPGTRRTLATLGERYGVPFPLI
jgi:LDH2 family malate/lactate/ureidoglycolate dehydrogenase